MKRIYLILLLMFSGHVFAFADISVGTLYDYMFAEKNTLLKRVRNFGDETAFVKITLAEIVYGADGVPKERQLQEEGLRQLVTSPSRLIIPAGGSQSSRFIYMGERDTERYFRVRFIPVKPQSNDIEALPFKNQISAGVNIMTGFGSILFVAPKKANYDTRFIRENGSIYVENRGNSTVVLDYLERCDINGGGCSEPEIIHILPGVKKQISKGGTKIVRFELVEGKKHVDKELSS
ncbi:MULTISPECIES: fimbrial biogenesis chaperone [Aeromonas]|uniref:hypothetical protein n=1 Tax=Aeromonas TaxID=642 RepID=UPI0012F34A14|nr:hypothetical protein [Aeromonas salmonicida]VXA77901.1 conserved exported hypothetical protein [Aeromonas salmonicida]